MNRTVVIDVVALTKNLLGKNTPKLSEFAKSGKVASIQPVIPAVTTTAQSTYLTGKFPDKHGIVGNGWYFKDECEIKFWKQSNHLVQADKIWDIAKKEDPTFTCANLFWWYNMYSTVDYSVTPRPMYLADGRKLPDIYTYPNTIRDLLQNELGQFPLFNFWGPASSIKSSKWIAKAAKWIETKYSPTLSLIYLPHLDYALQKYGPDTKLLTKDLQEIDAICGDLISFFQFHGVQVIILSEYNITTVNQPVHINRILRGHGLLTVREELGKEILDAGASKAFAVADHQIAHIYINDRSIKQKIMNLLKKINDIDKILDKQKKSRHNIDHPRSGDIIVLAKNNAWFSYYYWLDDHKAPDFARTVDIHRKPGYDPVELFINTAIKFPKLQIGYKLLKKKLGFRTLMDVIPLDANLVKGSHGSAPQSAKDMPIFITQKTNLLHKQVIPATYIFDLILNHLRSA